MGLSGFIFRLLWGELKKRLLPSWKDLALSCVLTIIFALACKSTIMGLAVFYTLSLLIIYLIPRLVYIIRAYMKYRQARKKISSVTSSVGKLADMLKK